MMELRLTLARVLFSFDVTVDGTLPNEYPILDHFTSQKDGPNVNFKRRNIAA